MSNVLPVTPRGAGPPMTWKYVARVHMIARCMGLSGRHSMHRSCRKVEPPPHKQVILVRALLTSFYIIVESAWKARDFRNEPFMYLGVASCVQFIITDHRHPCVVGNRWSVNAHILYTCGNVELYQSTLLEVRIGRICRTEGELVLYRLEIIGKSQPCLGG